jgi:hypothetical protein
MPEPVQNQEFDTKIVLSSRVFDLDGFVALNVQADSQMFDKVRRVSRSATLDGGAFITDFGYTDSDRTLTFNVNRLSRDDIVAVERLMRTYSEIGVSTYDGFYVGTMSGTSIRNGRMVLTILVKERLSND